MAIDRTYIPYEDDFLTYGFRPEHLFFDYAGGLGIGGTPLPDDDGGGDPVQDIINRQQATGSNTNLLYPNVGEESENLALQGDLAGHRGQGLQDLQLVNVQQGHPDLAQSVIGRTEEQTRLGKLGIDPGGAFITAMIGQTAGPLSPGVATLAGWAQEQWNEAASNPENTIATIENQRGQEVQAIIGPTGEIVAVGSSDIPQDMLEEFVRSNAEKISQATGAKPLSPAQVAPGSPAGPDLGDGGVDDMMADIMGGQAPMDMPSTAEVDAMLAEMDRGAPLDVAGPPAAGPIDVGPPSQDAGYQAPGGGTNEPESLLGPGYGQLSPQQQASLQSEMSELAGSMPSQQDVDRARDYLQAEEYARVGAGYGETAAPAPGTPSRSQQGVVSGAVEAGAGQLMDKAKDLLSEYSPAQLVGAAQASPAMRGALDELTGGAFSEAEKAAAAPAATYTGSAPAPYSAPGVPAAAPAPAIDVSKPTAPAASLNVAGTFAAAKARQAEKAAQFNAELAAMSAQQQQSAEIDDVFSDIFGDEQPMDMGQPDDIEGMLADFEQAAEYADYGAPAEDMFGSPADYAPGGVASPAGPLGNMSPAELQSFDEAPPGFSGPAGRGASDFEIRGFGGEDILGGGGYDPLGEFEAATDLGRGAMDRAQEVGAAAPAGGAAADFFGFDAAGYGSDFEAAQAYDAAFQAAQPFLDPITAGAKQTHAERAGSPLGPTTQTGSPTAAASPYGGGADTPGDQGDVGGGFGGGSESDVEASDPGQGGLGADPDNDPDAPGPDSGDGGGGEGTGGESDNAGPGGEDTGGEGPGGGWHTGGYVEGPDPTRHGEETSGKLLEGEVVLSQELAQLIGIDNLRAMQAAANQDRPDVVGQLLADLGRRYGG